MTRPQQPIPDPAQRTELNTQLLTTGADSGYWDDQGHPAPWPDDIDEWRPCINDPVTDF